MVMINNKLHRCWDRRSEEVTDRGLLKLGGRRDMKNYVPIFIMDVAFEGKYFTPSYGILEEFLRGLVMFQLREERWDVIKEADDGLQCAESICQDKSTLRLIAQKISDALSNRKKSTRVIFLKYLGYIMLHRKDTQEAVRDYDANDQRLHANTIRVNERSGGTSISNV